MDLKNRQVVHRAFGTGHIISVGKGHITIQFLDKAGTKMFCYPSAFRDYLKMSDNDAQKFVSGELQELLDKIAEERAEKKKKALEEVRRQELEKKEIRKTSARTRKTAKKPAAKKTTVKKQQEEGVQLKAEGNTATAL